MNNLIQQPQGRGNASSSEVLNGKTFTNDNGEQTGTMANNGAVSGSVGVGGSYTIPAGYHNGGGKVYGPTLDGNASTANVLSGATFYSNSGTKQTGTMVDRNQSSITYTSINSTPVQVADAWFCDTNSDGVKRLCFRTNGIAGYYGNNVLVSRPLTDFGTATADQVESGASFTSTSGVAISGTRPNYGYEPTASSMNLWQGNVYFYLPNETSQGHYATIGRSLKYPAWRFGACEAANVISGCTFSSSNGLSQTGTLTNHGAWGATISPGGSVTIPWGYHNGGGVVSASKGTPTVTVLKHVTDQSNVTYTTTAGQYSYIIVAHSGWGTDNGTGGQSDCYIDGTRKWRISHGNSCNRATCGGLNQTILNGSSSHTIKLSIGGDSIGGGILIVGVTV